MKKSACLFILGLALHGSLGWGGQRCVGDRCDTGMRPANQTSSGDSNGSDSQRPVAKEHKPEEAFIYGIKSQIADKTFNAETAKAEFTKLKDDTQKEAALGKLKEEAEKEKDTEKAKQLADLAAELEFRSEYEKLDEKVLRGKKAELLSKIVGGKSSNAEIAQARLITKMLAERKSESGQQGGGSALATVPGTKIVRGDQRIPISVSSDGKTQFVPSKTEGIVSVSTDGGRSSTDMPESKYGLKRNADGTYSQNNTTTVSAGDPQAVGVIHRPGGKAPAFEYKYTNKEGKEVVGFENSQGQWVEGNPQANSYSKASAPAGFKVENGRLVSAEPATRSSVGNPKSDGPIKSLTTSLSGTSGSSSPPSTPASFLPIPLAQQLDQSFSTNPSAQSVTSLPQEVQSEVPTLISPDRASWFHCPHCDSAAQLYPGLPVAKVGSAPTGYTGTYPAIAYNGRVAPLGSVSTSLLSRTSAARVRK